MEDRSPGRAADQRGALRFFNSLSTNFIKVVRKRISHPGLREKVHVWILVCYMAAQFEDEGIQRDRFLNIPAHKLNQFIHLRNRLVNPGKLDASGQRLELPANVLIADFVPA